MKETRSISVTDPFGVTADLEMPFLAEALNPLVVQRQFEYCLLSGLLTGKNPFHLCAIRVVRYKPGRRCLIEYEVEVAGRGEPAGVLTLVGKARAKGVDEIACHLLASLRNAGFGDDGNDGVRVPEPVGVIPKFRMWLQRKVPGTSATRLLAGPEGVALAQWIAEAIHKLHRAGIASPRRHTMADELKILHERLPLIAQLKPEWARRLERLLDACDRLGVSTLPPRPRGIHRDFYADHVIVDGSRLYLLDFDLYCEGDPGLDVGNFVAHLTEQSLRTLGDPNALRHVERALADRFVGLAGEATRVAVCAYTTLTLVRHIYLSTRFLERRHSTERLLQLCEARLAANG